MIICILGRQPAIGLAELEALYGAHVVTPFGDTCALVDADVDFSRLGSTVKMARVATDFPGSNVQRAFAWANKNVPQRLEKTTGKLQIGISVYGASISTGKVNAAALTLKKALRNAGHSVRVSPNTEPALSSAQSFHNKLAGRQGYELVVATDGKRTVVARLTDVQDIDAYTLRDRSRPKRDAFVGMLPPKLAQTIINLAAGPRLDGEQTLGQAVLPNESDSAFPAGARQERELNQLAPSGSDEIGKAAGATPVVLDPFCGTGVILMEAALMGYNVYGTDLSEKMVRFTRDNMGWLQEKYDTHPDTALYEAADARDHIWRQPVDCVACEGYLGQPLGGQNPSTEKLQQIIADCDKVMHGFLENISSQLQPGTRLCIAMPSWFIGDKIFHLTTLDDLEKLGYNRIDFVHANATDLIYHRDDQVVGRELVVLTKE